MTTQVEVQAHPGLTQTVETVTEGRPGRWAWLQRLILRWQEAQYLNWQYGLSSDGEDP